MEEYNVSYKTSFHEFAHKNSKDERFRAIDKQKDRENLFNDYISELRRKEKEEKAAQREKVIVDHFCQFTNNLFLFNQANFVIILTMILMFNSNCHNNLIIFPPLFPNQKSLKIINA